MSDDLAITKTDEIPLAPEVDNIFLAATNRNEMMACQSKLAEWLKAKVKSVTAERLELQSGINHAKAHKWSTRGLQSALSRCNQRKMYYEKLLAATEAGYVIIPWTWTDVFAVRVTRENAKTIQSNISKYDQPAIPDQPSDLAPVGEGRYVSDASEGIHRRGPGEIENGKPTTIYFSEATGFKDVEFPVMAAKPVLMNATAQAMALRIFDEIGVAPNRKGKDPIITGTVKGPQRNTHFIIAWYLDTRAL